MDVCSECAMRLFNTKHHNLQGIGNPYFGNLIVVPNVDYVAYKHGSMDFSSQVELIMEVLHLPTGEVNDLYIAPFIRCNTQISCELTDDIVQRCLRHLASDMKKYNYRNILLLGDAARRILNCDIKDNLNTLMVSRNNRFYNVNYSPLIKYTDENKFETFKSYLRRWYSWCKSRNCCYDNIIKV